MNKSWWKRWLNELATVVWSFGLCALFWVIWVYGSEDGEAPIMASNLIRIFWALFKLSCFSALGWMFAFAYSRRYSMATGKESSSMYEWLTWVVVTFCLSLNSL